MTTYTHALVVFSCVEGPAPTFTRSSTVRLILLELWVFSSVYDPANWSCNSVTPSTYQSVWVDTSVSQSIFDELSFYQTLKSYKYFHDCHPISRQDIMSWISIIDSHFRIDNSIDMINSTTKYSWSCLISQQDSKSRISIIQSHHITVMTSMILYHAASSISSLSFYPHDNSGMCILSMTTWLLPTCGYEMFVSAFQLNISSAYRRTTHSSMVLNNQTIIILSIDSSTLVQWHKSELMVAADLWLWDVCLSFPLKLKFEVLAYYSLLNGPYSIKIRYRSFSDDMICRI